MPTPVETPPVTRTQTFVARSRFEVPVSELWAWHARPGAFDRLNPRWDPARVLEHEGDLEKGRVVLSVPMGPLSKRWVAEHRAPFEREKLFTDEQLSGPFASWVHSHHFSADGPDASWLEDRIEYALPLGAPGRLAGSGYAARKLKRVFDWRHALTRGDLARHRQLAAPKALTVAITGASGLVGSALAAFLTTGGHTVRRIVRKAAGAGEISWDPAGGTIDAKSLEGVDAVVHLAGENIASGRWTAARKARILESRVQGTRLLAETLARLDAPPATFVSASAIGFYGSRGDQLLDEESSTGTGFLAEVCRAWESAAEPARAKGIRTVNLRIGVALAANGGALAKMLPPFLMGGGGPIGDGRQYMSWIGLDDLVGAIAHALVRKDLEGPVNAVSPNPVTNGELAKILGKVLGRPSFMPLPAFAARALMGEMAEELLLSSARVMPRKLVATGFRFQHPDLEGALRFELGRL